MSSSSPSSSAFRDSCIAGGARESHGPARPGRRLPPQVVNWYSSWCPREFIPISSRCTERSEDAATSYGVVAEVDAPPRFDVALQVKVIEDLIARGVSGIAISANDDRGLVAVIHEAIQAGIKVITFDAPAPSSEALTYIGTDNESAGYAAGKRMAAAMGGQGSIAVLQGGLDATNLNLRTKGFTRALAEAAPRDHGGGGRRRGRRLLRSP